MRHCHTDQVENTDWDSSNVCSYKYTIANDFRGSFSHSSTRFHIFEVFIWRLRDTCHDKFSKRFIYTIITIFFDAFIQNNISYFYHVEIIKETIYSYVDFFIIFYFIIF